MFEEFGLKVASNTSVVPEAFINFWPIPHKFIFRVNGYAPGVVLVDGRAQKIWSSLQ